MGGVPSRIRRPGRKDTVRHPEASPETIAAAITPVPQAAWSTSRSAQPLLKAQHPVHGSQ